MSRSRLNGWLGADRCALRASAMGYSARSVRNQMRSLTYCPILSIMESCALCGATGVPLTDEDVIPKWALRAFDVQGAVTIQVREEGGSPQEVGKRRTLKLVLEGGLCQQCNNVRLSQLRLSRSSLQWLWNAGRRGSTRTLRGCSPLGP